MVNLDNIFQLFGSNDNLDGSSNNNTTFMDFKVTPVYWVGMYKKLISKPFKF